MDDQQPGGHIVTQQLVREIATQVIRKQMLGLMGGAGDVIGTCRDHPTFTTLPTDDRNNLISAVFDATQTAHVTITWDEAPVRRVTYPEIDYPQVLRDQHEPWPLDAELEAVKRAWNDHFAEEAITLRPAGIVHRDRPRRAKPEA